MSYVEEVEVGKMYQVRAQRTVHYPAKMAGTKSSSLLRWANAGDVIRVDHALEAKALQGQSSKLSEVGEMPKGAFLRDAAKHPPTFRRAISAYGKKAKSSIEKLAAAGDAQLEGLEPIGGGDAVAAEAAAKEAATQAEAAAIAAKAADEAAAAKAAEEAKAADEAAAAAKKAAKKPSAK